MDMRRAIYSTLDGYTSLWELDVPIIGKVSFAVVGGGSST